MAFHTGSSLQPVARNIYQSFRWLLYGDDKNIDDVIYDEVREFMMDKSDFGYHGTLRNDLTGNEYYLQLYKFEEPLRDYVKSVILNIY